MTKRRTAVLMMQPNVEPMTWEEFCEKTESNSVAIDGFVKTGPKFQSLKEGGPRANLNHHEDVDRFSTRATCAQALLDIRTGFFDAFQDQDGPFVRVYGNDCDQDVCTTWFLFKYGWMAEQVLNPRLNKLVHMEDMLDTTGGAYPFPKDMPILSELAWVFQPYTQFRLSGGLSKFRTAECFTSVVEDVEHRIMKYLHNEGGSIPLDTRYERLGGGPGWTMVREIGAHARTGMLSDGIRAFVSVREEGGILHYSIGRMSNKNPFDVPFHVENFNKVEKDPRMVGGCGNTIGGSNRQYGTSHTYKALEEIVNSGIVIA